MSERSDEVSAVYRFVHLKEVLPGAMQQIQAIYDVSFPRHERKPFSMIADGIQAGRYTVLVVNRERGAVSEIIAFALMLRLRTSQAAYIEYLAVAEALRRQGIGSLLLHSMVAFFMAEASSAIVWEVDPPELPGDEQERRIRFYERLGAHLITKSKHYGMPNYWQGSGIVAFRLMWIPLKQQRDQPTKAELVAFITDIYETEYRGQDAIRDTIIASLDNP